MIRKLIREYLQSPSAYEGNWWGHIRNRSQHMLLGLAGGWCFFAWLSWVGWAGFLLAYVAVEANQYLNHGAQLWDSVEDFGDVLAGALAALGWWPVLIVQSVFLISSAMRRRS